MIVTVPNRLHDVWKQLERKPACELSSPTL